jgi:site-specific recombinase XerD
MRYGNMALRNNRSIGGFSAMRLLSVFSECALSTRFQFTFGPMAGPDKLPKFLSDEEVESLLARPNERYYSPCRDKLMMRVQLSAGLRPGEVVAPKAEHVGFNSGRIDVREGKGAKDRVVFVGNRLVEDLQA